jgi:glycosyltransferase involved in cell wall biosynthesis
MGRGHDVHIVSFHPTPIPDVTFPYMGTSSRDGSLPKYLYLWRTLRVRRLLRRIDPDIVLATYIKSNGLLGALAKHGVLVVSIRGTDFEFPLPFGLDDALVRWITSRAEFLHASSPELAERLAEKRVPLERFTIIPMGTDPEVFTPREGERPPGPVRIICTRKHHAYYDNPTIVRAASLLREQGVPFQLRFLGPGSTTSAAAALASEMALANVIEFLEEVEPHEVPDHLAWADLYVSAALSDGASSSLFEAMSCGLFPVVTDVRANRDWIESGRNGYLFPPGDAQACARCLRQAWEDAELRREAAAANRQTVIEQLDRRAGLERLEHLLERAVQVAGKPA